MRVQNNWVLVVVSLLVLAACSGGGGSSGGSNGGGNGGGGTPEPPVEISLGSDHILLEGSTGNEEIVEYSVTLDKAATSAVTFDYLAEHVSTEDNDFLDRSGTITIAAGATQAVIQLGINGDTAFEWDEEYLLQLSNPSANATIVKESATGIIVNDDELRFVMEPIYIGEHTSNLGKNFAEFTFEYHLYFDASELLDILDLFAFDLPYDIYAEDDINLFAPLASGTLRIVNNGGNGTGQQITVTLPVGPETSVGSKLLIVFDWSAVIELASQLQVNIEYLATIEDQDVGDDWAILGAADESVFNEGSAGESSELNFTVFLSKPLTEDIVVHWQTADHTATAPDDYIAESGDLYFSAGETEIEINVTVNGDDDVEDLETFYLLLSTDAANVLTRTKTIAYINNDDFDTDFRRISISHPELIEGDSDTSDMVFEVTLDQPAASPITFGFTTGTFGNDGATPDVDFTTTTGDRTFQVGESLVTITVPIIGDTDPEEDEYFTLSTTAITGNAVVQQQGIGNILTDDPIVRLSFASAGIPEGNSGTNDLTFSVLLDLATTVDIDLNVVTSDITAIAGEDYTAVDTIITIPAGNTSATFNVEIIGDVQSEDDEVFRVTLSTDSTSAILLNTTADGTIINDDSAGGWAGAELVQSGSPDSYRPRVSYGPGTETQVVYLHNFKVWRRVSPAQGVWNDAEEIGNIFSMAYTPRLAVAANGDALVLWRSSNFPNIGNYSVASSWVTDVLSQTTEIRLEPNMASNFTSGEAIAIWDAPWGTGTVSDIWAAHYSQANGWELNLVEQSSDRYSYNPQIAMAANGDVMAVFEMEKNPGTNIIDVVAYRYDGGTWIESATLDNLDSDFASGPKIAMNDSGNAAVVWYQRQPVVTGLSRRAIYFNKYDAVNDMWSGAALVEEDVDHTAEKPEVAIDADGNIFVIWLQTSDGPPSRQDLMVNRYDAKLDQWSGPQLLENDDTAGPFPIMSHQIHADNNGNAIAVWVQDDGNVQNLRTARYSAADDEWTAAELLEETDNGDVNIPHFIMNRTTGNAMVVWHQDDNGDVEIWANRFTAP